MFLIIIMVIWSKCFAIEKFKHANTANQMLIIIKNGIPNQKVFRKDKEKEEDAVKESFSSSTMKIEIEF